MTHHVAFTGTRNGMTLAQMQSFRTLLEGGDYILHNGSARGADKDAADIADELGVPVIAHPASDVKSKDRVMLSHAVEYRVPEPALVRNQTMVDESEYVIATPKGWNEERRGSGTWATIRYALKTGKSLLVVWPDGETTGLY